MRPYARLAGPLNACGDLAHLWGTSDVIGTALGTQRKARMVAQGGLHAVLHIILVLKCPAYGEYTTP